MEDLTTLPDPEAFAAQTQVSRGRPCGTCSNKPLKEWIHRVLEAWAKKDNEGQPNLTALWVKLRECFGYKYGEQALRYHIANHEIDLWSKIQGR